MTRVPALALTALAVTAAAEPALRLDLATLPASPDVLTRVYGSVGNGSRGLPVAGGGDLDGDGAGDVAVAAMQASPLSRVGAGQVFVSFGSGTIGGSVDTAQTQAGVLAILGAQASEHAGSEIWMDDVTGDGIADLLICRQDYSPTPTRIGAGALTIVQGGPALRSFAATLQPLDLASPDPSLTLFNVLGSGVQDRFCMWVRTGDVTGDDVADLVVGADQAGSGDEHRGEAYVLRGGVHLAANATADLARFSTGGFLLAGNSIRILPPDGSTDFHLGATCQIADLDGNGRGEVLLAATLNRAGGGLRPASAPEIVHGSGGTADGSVYIVWDDNIPPGGWDPGLTLSLAALPGELTTIQGSLANDSFGEELLGGLDFDGDGNAELFVGDLTGSAPGNRSVSGLGHVLYNAQVLKGLSFDMDNLPTGVAQSLIYGPIVGAISADTAMQGDFDNDGLADLAFSSPHDAPFGRINAGTLHILFGRPGGWPDVIDLAPGRQPPANALRLAEVYGGRGNLPGDQGDTLAYSGAAGDLDGDGRVDVVTNEMIGNGVAPGTVDVGNLIVLSGRALSDPLFRSGFELD
ncbi:MAG: hypothetical protein QNJ40_16985 [Xanthomonadales bacterium]|nr:hypothetical protein [Xanthomonadales bacterium]